jgi:hypothetical protein
MTSEYFFFDVPFSLFGIAIGIILLRRIIQSVKAGAIEWYYGEQFRISKSEAPIAFWAMIIMYLCICAVFIFGALKWLL